MGQGEVLSILKKEKLATSGELAEKLGVNVYAVQRSLNRMLNLDVERMIIQVGHARGGLSYVWKIKGVKIPKSRLLKYQKNDKKIQPQES